MYFLLEKVDFQPAMLMYQNKIFFRVGLVVGMAFSTHWAPIQVFRLVVGPTVMKGCLVGGIETSIEIIYSKWVSTVQSIIKVEFV